MFAKITVLIMEAVKQQIRDFNAKHFPIILKVRYLSVMNMFGC